MAKKKYDKARVGALLAVIRDGAEPAEADGPALAFLAGDGDVEQLDTDAALAALQAAVVLGRPEPVQAAQAARNKVVRKAARGAAHRLKSTGIQVEEARTSTGWTLGKEERVAQAPLALVGLPEEDGYVPFLLASFGDEGACISAGVAGPGQGFRDDDHAHTSRTQARKIIDDARGDHRLHPVPFHEAVALLESAFDAAGGKRPGGWAHLLSHIDEGTLNATRLLDPLRALPQELDVDALHRHDFLMDGNWAVAMQPSVEELTPFLETVMEVLGSELYPDGDARRARVEEVVDEAADALLAGPARGSWAWSLDVVATLAQRSGDEAPAQVARATALALREGRAGRDVPWAREWVSRQLSFVADMAMRMGQGPATAE